jgi:hypothetical protein
MDWKRDTAAAHLLFGRSSSWCYWVMAASQRTRRPSQTTEELTRCILVRQQPLLGKPPPQCRQFAWRPKRAVVPDGLAACRKVALPQMPVELAVGHAECHRRLFHGEVVHTLDRVSRRKKSTDSARIFSGGVGTGKSRNRQPKICCRMRNPGNRWENGLASGL